MVFRFDFIPNAAQGDDSGSASVRSSHDGESREAVGSQAFLPVQELDLGEQVSLRSSGSDSRLRSSS